MRTTKVRTVEEPSEKRGEHKGEQGRTPVTQDNIHCMTRRLHTCGLSVWRGSDIFQTVEQLEIIEKC